MADLKQLRQRVKRYVTDCPNFIIDTAINDAARKFLDDTLLWKKDVPFSLAADQSVYEIGADVIPTGTDAIIVARVQLDVDTDPLAKSNDGELPKGLRKPCAYFCTTPNEMHVGPTPDQIYDCVLTLALKPSLNKMDAPAFLITTSGKHIAHGAIAELKAQEGQTWFDPATLDYHQHQFDDEVTRLKTAALKGFAGANLSVQPRRFI